MAALQALRQVLCFYYNWCQKLVARRGEGEARSSAGAGGDEASASNRKLRRFQYKELKRATGGFSERQRLGRGGFGAVYRGVLRDGQVVAIKRLDRSSLQGDREFESELSICGALSPSSHVVNLIGYCTDGKRIRLLVYEHMENRSLQDALFDPAYPARLDWKQRLQIIQDTASALRFLHLHCDPPVIHGDIKPSNILLDHGFRARIADFGLARVKSPEPDPFGLDADDRCSVYSATRAPPNLKVKRGDDTHRPRIPGLSPGRSTLYQNRLVADGRVTTPSRDVEMDDVGATNTVSMEGKRVMGSPSSVLDGQNLVAESPYDSVMIKENLDIGLASPVSKMESLFRGASYEQEKQAVRLAFPVSDRRNLVSESSYFVSKDVRMDLGSACPVLKDEDHAALNDEENLGMESPSPVLNKHDLGVSKQGKTDASLAYPIMEKVHNLVTESPYPLTKEVQMDMGSTYPCSKDIRMDMRSTYLASTKEERLEEEVCSTTAKTRSRTAVNGGDRLGARNRDEESMGKKYVMDWLGSEVHGSRKKAALARPEKLASVDEEEPHHASGATGGSRGNAFSSGSQSKREGRARSSSSRKSREWWKDEYFAELNSKSEARKKKEAARAKDEEEEDEEEEDGDGWEAGRRRRSVSREWFRSVVGRQSRRRGRRRRRRIMQSTTNNGDDNGDALMWWWGYGADEDASSTSTTMTMVMMNQNQHHQHQNNQQWSGELSSSIRDASSTTTTTSMRGTICYIAPESNGGPASEKADIYSFGVLVLVILAGRRPIQVSASSPLREFERANLVAWARSLSHSPAKILDLVDPRLGRDYDPDQARLCIGLALLCLHRVPTSRPDISRVLKILSREIGLDPSPSPSNRSPSSSSSAAAAAADDSKLKLP